MATEGALQRYRSSSCPILVRSVREPRTRSTTSFDEGGHVVLTGSSGVTEDGGIETRRPHPGLMQIGTPKSGDELWSTYVTDTEQTEIGELSLHADR